MKLPNLFLIGLKKSRKEIMLSGKVAIVGRPNVGKSTIFNRIIGTRYSIVSDEAGVTRDRIYGKGIWLTKEFSLIDTGGIEIENRTFQEQIRSQAEIAIEEADVILFIVDARTGVTDDDKLVTRILRKSGKPIVLAANKVDDQHLKDGIYDFYSLGIGDPIPTSGIHGIGIGDILDQIIKLLPDKEEQEDASEIKFCLIGRPNVGKSSLVNAILDKDRVIVSNVEGTTRDAIDTPFERDGVKYSVVDTAGLKKRGRIYEAVDKYSALRALMAIERSDIVLLLIDASTGIREQDKNIVSYALDNHKAIVIVVNKWDAIEKDEKTMSDFTKKIRNEFKFIDYAPIVFVSALNKSRLPSLFEALKLAYEGATKRIKTSTLNQVVMDAQHFTPPAEFNGGTIKINYSNQVGTKPPTIIFFCNNPEFLHFSYKRYLENQLREAFGFEGSPINMVFRAKSE